MNEVIIKVSVAGEGGTGKTSLLHRLVTGTFKEDMKMTIGTGLMSYNTSYNNFRIIYQLWDFAGEKRFRFFLPNYLKGSKAILLCFDSTRFNSFQNLTEWYNIVKENINIYNTYIYLISTKIDLTQRRAVFKDSIDNWMKDKKIDRFFESSALSGENIKEIFNKLTEDIYSNIKSNMENE